MGRVKTFDEQQVLEQAMLTFWRNGYQATTYSMLETNTGLSGRSLINAFGDKDAIFERVLLRYHAIIRERLTSHFQPPGIAAIQDFFEDLASAKRSDPRNHGCLILNSIYEMGKLTPAAHNIVLGFRAMFIEFFTQSLRNENVAEPDEKAELVVVFLWGIGSQIRLAGQVRTAAVAIAGVIRLLEEWKKTSLS